MKQTSNPAIIVRDIDTNAEVSRVEMQTPFNDRRLERVLTGLLNRMDTDRFYADESECDVWLAKNLKFGDGGTL